MSLINETLGFDVDKIKQGSSEWEKARLGVITASRFHDIIKPGRKKGSYSEARRSYMLELIAEVCTGKSKYISTSSGPTAWGHEHEEFAREAYEAETFLVVDEMPIIYKSDSMRCAASPDGIIGLSKGLEIKSPYTSSVHIDTILTGKIKPEYITQMQYSMWVTGFDSWDFCSYDPRMKGDSSRRLHIINIERDEEIIKTFDEEVDKFILDMDVMLHKLGYEYGMQWG